MRIAMRARFWQSLVLTVALVAALAGAARADESGLAKRHFDNGLRLFQDHNYTGALVEFDASFQQNPTAVALQNIAVCQKALFRYADAVATLDQLLRERGRELSPEDRKAAEDAEREMRALLGKLVVRVAPPEARVSINDRPIRPESLKSPILLAPGEYRVRAELSGYRRAEQSVSVSSGETERTVDLQLTHATGTIHVEADDAKGAIAIDGVQVGYGQWTGPATAGPHEVVVFTDTLRSRTTATVTEGQTAEVGIKLTGPQAGVPPAYEPLQSTYVPQPAAKGRYGALLLSGGGLMVPKAGTLDNNDQVSTRGAGGMLGLVLGNRFSERWLGEVWAGVGSSPFSTQCTIAACAKNAGTAAEQHYDVVSARVGVNGRISSNGRKARVFGLLGLGLVGHFVKSSTDAADTTRKDASPFAQGGGGLEVDFGRWFASGALLVGIEQLKTWDDAREGVGTANLELRLGYGRW